MAEIALKIKGSLDEISDEQINKVREDLYEFMCMRRKLLGVVEYKISEPKTEVSFN